MSEEAEGKAPEMTVLGQNLSDVAETIPASDQAAEENKSYLNEFVGEGKKYKDLNEAAEALAKNAIHAKKHIETLEAENKDFRSRAGVEDEILAYIRQSTAQSSSDSKASLNEIKESVNTQGMGKDEILSVVKDYFAAKEKETAVKTTQQTSWEKLKEAAGGEGAAKLALAAYIGKDEKKRQLIDTLAITDPEGLVKLVVDRKAVKNFSSAGEGAVVSTENFTPETLTWAQVKKVEKENPKLYKSRKFQAMIHSPQFKI